MAWETNGPVVVPIDFSGMSIPALQAALQMASQPDQIHVVHVVIELDQIAPGSHHLSLPSDEDRRQVVHEHFSSYLSENRIEGVRQVVLEGRPGTAVPEYATRIGAELIVVPSHGYGGVKRMLLGSVAEQIIRRADCPVFVLRRRDAE
ncbi:MAG: universal stress protein [Planctomycetaceae bacterium]|nr:universal stress protein [Planctomycetaceae bacterium]